MMKRWKSVLSLTLVLSLLAAAGCKSAGTGQTSLEGTESQVSSGSGASQEEENMFTDRDYETSYDESASVLIELNGSTASASSDSVQISGTRITITEEATYIISGTLDDGMIIVNGSDTAKIQLVLDGASINSESSAALYILEGDKVFVTLAEGTQNTLTNGGTFTAIDENNIDGAVYSRQDLTFNGSGSLTVTSPTGHGIVSNDDLVITGGTYDIASASHGLKANDSVRITGDTSVAIDSGKDGIHAENDEDTSLGFVYIAESTFDIEAEGDGISSGAYMQLENGTFQILAGGGSENGANESSQSWGGFRGGKGPGQSDFEADGTEDSSTSMKGLKAAGDMQILGGTFTIDSADDSVHSNASITISGGSFDIASGDDAFHGDETLTVSGGTIQITESYEGLEALHVNVEGGDITLSASDDGLNAAGGTDSSGTTGGRDGRLGGRGDMGGMSSSNGSVTISGGTLYVNASGDGIDANGTLTISGGYTVITGPTQGDTATLDYDTSGVISGGTFIGTGASRMAQTFSDSQQGVISVNVGEQSGGTKITLTDSSGNTLIDCAPEESFAVVILSSPQIVSGETYTLAVGSAQQEVTAS